MVKHFVPPALQTFLHLIFLWGYKKDRVYATPVADRDKLKAKIQAVVGTVTEDVL